MTKPPEDKKPKRNRKLRSGFSTGACAAAAAKAAGMLLCGGQDDRVEIPFPDGSRNGFQVHFSEKTGDTAKASVIKDAGDDPDVTNGAEIGAEVCLLPVERSITESCLELGKLTIFFEAGDGVGTVTKPGLAIPPGQPAINPMPRQMIAEALAELFDQQSETKTVLKVTISVVNGEELAEKTLNHRLGIVGGLSILGTTGIVRPVSADAWTATIVASMDVAVQTGSEEIVLSTGRTSEKAVQEILNLQEEAYAMMGDYLSFSLEAARDHGFNRIHLAAMWAKVVKAAMAIPQTHVRHGALEADQAARFIGNLMDDQELTKMLLGSNTAREIYRRLSGEQLVQVRQTVCKAAQDYAQKVSGLPVTVYLVVANGQVVERVQ